MRPYQTVLLIDARYPRDAPRRPPSTMSYRTRCGEAASADPVSSARGRRRRHKIHCRRPCVLDSRSRDPASPDTGGNDRRRGDRPAHQGADWRLAAAGLCHEVALFLRDTVEIPWAIFHPHAAPEIPRLKRIETHGQRCHANPVGETRIRWQGMRRNSKKHQGGEGSGQRVFHGTQAFHRVTRET
jgi:hypothetical protein